MQNLEVTHAPQKRHVTRDQRVTKGVTSPYATSPCPQRLKDLNPYLASNASGWVPLATIMHHPSHPKSESAFKSQPPPPGRRVLHWHRHPPCVNAPGPCVLGRCPQPLCTGSASPTLRGVWTHPTPASAQWFLDSLCRSIDNNNKHKQHET